MKLVPSTKGRWFRLCAVALCVLTLASTIPGTAFAQNPDPAPDPILIGYSQLGAATEGALEAVLLQSLKDALANRTFGNVIAKVLFELVLGARVSALAAKQAYLDSDEARERFFLLLTMGEARVAIGLTPSCSVCGNLRSDLQQVIDVAASLRLQARPGKNKN